LRLRFAVLATDRRLSAWQVEALRRLTALEGVVPTLFLEDRRQFPRPLGDRVLRAWRRRAVPALRHTDPGPLLTGVPIQVVSRPSDLQLQADGHQGVDFVLDLRDREASAGPWVPPGILGARYGVWSLVHEDPFLVRNGDRRGPRTARFHLQVETADRAHPLIVRQGHGRVVPWAYGRTLHSMFLLGAALPAAVCGVLRSGGEGSAPPGAADAEPDAEVRPRMPVRTRDLLSAAVRLVMEKVRRGVRFLFRTEEWTLGLIRAPIHALLDGRGLRDHVVVPTPGGGRFFADPFGIPGEDGIRILCEGYDFQRRTGWLAELEIDLQGRVVTPPQPSSLQFPHHTSFPYLFRHEDRWYCVPETYQAGTVTLWETDGAFARWRRVATLLEQTPLLDPVVVRHEGLWWLMGTPRFAGDSMSSLALWYAEELLGPWHAHAGNPVKVDVRSARCAGTPFLHGGKLHRPAQDCARSYGSGVIIHRIDRLTPTDFTETPVARVDPDPATGFPDGIHTLSAVGDQVLCDMKRHSFIPVAPVADVGHRILARVRALTHR